MTTLPWTRMPAEEIETVKSCYDVSWRKYHNWKHPVSMWQRAADLNLAYDEHLDRAILWHDAIDRVHVHHGMMHPLLSEEFHSATELKIYHQEKKTGLGVNPSVGLILTTEKPSFLGDARLNTLDLMGIAAAAKHQTFQKAYQDTLALFEERKAMDTACNKPKTTWDVFLQDTHRFLTMTAARLHRELITVNPPEHPLYLVQRDIVVGMHSLAQHLMVEITKTQS